MLPPSPRSLTPFWEMDGLDGSWPAPDGAQVQLYICAKWLAASSVGFNFLVDVYSCLFMDVSLRSRVAV